MAAAWVDGVLFTPTLGGTTDWVVSAAVQGYMTPALAGAVNLQVYKYRAESADQSQWEVGEGTYTVGTTTLTRTTVLYNSSGTGTAAGQSGAGTKINFTTVPQVGIVPSKLDIISAKEGNSFSATQQTQLLSNMGNAALASALPILAVGAGGRLNSSENINNVVTDGFYFVEATCTNQPVASTQYYLLVQKYPASTGFVQQTAWDLTATGGVWTRNINSGTPTAWVHFLSDGLPMFKVGAFTRVMSLASGNQSITGVGFKPRYIGFQTGISGGSPTCSVGNSDGVSNTCLEISITSIFPQSTAGIQREAAAGANYNTFNIASMDVDGFTVAWTKVGTPTATASVNYTCYR